MPNSPRSLTPRAFILLGVITLYGSHWVSRREIAKRLALGGLSAWDIKLLALLVRTEMIEAKRQHASQEKWVYRVKPPQQ